MNSNIGHNLPDKELVDRVLGGNTQAFTLIVRQTERLVAQIVYKMIARAEDRQDLVQEVYMKAFHQLKGFRFQAKLSTWIATIAYNSCVSWLQKRKLTLTGHLNGAGGEMAESMQAERADDCGDGPESQLYNKERMAVVRAQMDRLPPVYKTLLVLYHQEDCSYDEIAAITNLPEGTVKSYLFRARKALKENVLSVYNKDLL